MVIALKIDNDVSFIMNFDKILIYLMSLKFCSIFSSPFKVPCDYIMR
uniref:Uncharacterized protein n=1 Tax=Anguilla anguilla TaxID=7936 RepID=A0A0E9QNS5_ANGAN